MDSLITKDSSFEVDFCILKSENTLVRGMDVYYTLSKTGNKELKICVSTARECESVFVCGEREAIEFFELLVRNAVTPCTLHDVFEDVFEE